MKIIRDISQYKISVILLSYNSSHDLKECIPSVLKQNWPNVEIIVVDNASTDGTPSFIRSTYPEITLIETGSNCGYAGGNNIGANYADGDIVIVANPDTLMNPRWLLELIKPFYYDPSLKATTSKIMVYGQERINTCANLSHFTGVTFCRGLNEAPSGFSAQEEVGAVSGCSFAIRGSAFRELGYFDPDFFLYLEDTDLSWRLRLAGYRIKYAPSSVLHHKFKLTVSPQKVFYLERNRYRMLLKSYGLKSLLIISPSLLLTEAITWGYAIINGRTHIIGKLRAYLWAARSLGKIMVKRREVQKSRKVGDGELIRLLEWRIPFEQMINNRLIVGVADAIFNNFYRVNYAVLERLTKSNNVIPTPQ